MTGIAIAKIALYLGVIIALTPLLGGYMKRVFAGEKTLLDPVLRPLERGIYRVCGVDAKKDQGWIEWTIVMLVVNAASLVILYGMQRLQKVLPFNPERPRARLARLLLEHGRLVHDEHELAGLLRRVHDVAFHADGGARAPQLPLGRHGHRDRRRRDPRDRPGEGERDRKLLVRLHAGDPLGAPAVLLPRGALLRLARASCRTSTPTSP